MTYGRGNEEMYTRFPGIFRLAIFVLERSISDYGAKVSRRISRERKKKKKKKEVSWVAKSTLVLLPIWRMR